MAVSPIRFIHASDFHLEKLPQDLAEVPDHLRDRLLEAATLAATKVFEAAVNEQVDFLVLSGDIVAFEKCAPSTILFLVEQFERLAAREIPVYWLGGRSEAGGNWPTECAVPANVNQFPPGHTVEHIVRRKGEPLARVLGQSYARGTKMRPTDYEAETDELPVIAVARGKFDAAAVARVPVTYWALGGSHNSTTIASGKQAAHYSGSSQGRSTREAGIHGCTLVKIEADRRCTLSTIATDVLRYENLRLVIGAETTREDLNQQIRGKAEVLQAVAPTVDRLITWTCSGAGPLLESVRRGELGIELLPWLRSEFGMGSPALWTLELNVEPPDSFPPQWYAEDTLLGDFLQTVQTLEQDENLPIDLRSYVQGDELVQVLGKQLRFDDQHSRQQLLRQVALLGTDLLGGEEPRA